MSGSTFTSNSASIDGGGLDNFGTATVSGSTFTSNSAVRRRRPHNLGTATVSGSTFTSNSASAVGGGLDNIGTATVSGSSFTSNSASFGGGLANESGGTATVSGSSFTSNSATFGGGLDRLRDGDGERQLLHQQLRRHDGGGLSTSGRRR